MSGVHTPLVGATVAHHSQCRNDNALDTLPVDRQLEVAADVQRTGKAILLHRNNLALMEPTHPWRWSALYELANALVTRFSQKRQIQDIDEAVLTYREALSLRPEYPPYRFPSLNGLAAALHMRFEESDQLSDLEEAVSLYRRAFHHLSEHDVNRSMALGNFADALQALFTRTRQLQDLEDAISLHRQALVLRPDDHPDRLSSLNNLAATLFDRFRQTSQLKDVDEAISLHREVLTLRTARDPNRSTTLSNLAMSLHGRFNQTSQFSDLDDAVSLQQEALQLRPVPHPQRWSSLNNIAMVREARFKETRQLPDLDDAILSYREALVQVQEGHPHRPISFANLATALYARYDETRQLHNLDEAISLHRDALVLFTADDLNRPSTLINLASALHIRSQDQNRPSDLDETIILYREALTRLTANHPHRSISLINLAMALHTRFEQTSQVSDLDESISLYYDALSLLPPTHVERGTLLHSLARAFRTKFHLSGQLQDADEAIEFCRRSLQESTKDHPRNCSVSTTLGRLFLDRFKSRELQDDIEKQHGDLIGAVDAFRTGACSESASVSERFIAAKIWVRLVDSLNGAHGSALEAYQTAIGLLPRMAVLGSDVQSRRDALTPNIDGFARDAAAWAIDQNRFAMAIEFLEEGRAIFWAQALQLRTPLNELESKASELAQKLKDISHALERGSLRPVSREVMSSPEHGVSAERETIRYRQLNTDWLATVEEVRQLDGFHYFLRAKSFAELSVAAKNGPVVILNASEREHKCAALVMRFSQEPVHIPLPQLSSKAAASLVKRLRSLPDASFPLARGERHIRRVRQVSEDADSILREVLATLWLSVVQPVLHSLDLQKSDLPPRLWWLPTGPFASLPIHAAGIYDAPDSECTSDYVISSYTSTLSALLAPSPHAPEHFKVLAVIQPVTNEQAPLPYTIDELQKIEAHVPNECLIRRGVPGAPTYVTEVLADIPTASIVHLACHGVQDVWNPLDSALLLEDGRLRVSQLMELDMPNASLVFLSACQTAMVGDDLPDESMHLAATLLFSGFRGAVATMWSIKDCDGPSIADGFYRRLFSAATEGTPPDTACAARALHSAVAELRDKLDTEQTESRFMRWVPFVHLGL